MTITDLRYLGADRDRRGAGVVDDPPLADRTGCLMVGNDNLAMIINRGTGVTAHLGMVDTGYLSGRWTWDADAAQTSPSCAQVVGWS